MKPVREKESVRERVKEESNRGEKIIERERESVLDGEKRRKRKTKKSKDLACNNMLGKSIPVKFVNQKNGKGRSSPIKSRRGTQAKFLRKKRRAGGALPELSIPVTSRVYFSAIIHGHLRGDGVYVFRDVYVNRSSRETHIFISLLNEGRKGER